MKTSNSTHTIKGNKRVHGIYIHNGERERDSARGFDIKRIVIFAGLETCKHHTYTHTTHTLFTALGVVVVLEAEAEADEEVVLEVEEEEEEEEAVVAAEEEEVTGTSALVDGVGGRGRGITGGAG